MAAIRSTTRRTRVRLHRSFSLPLWKFHRPAVAGENHTAGHRSAGVGGRVVVTRKAMPVEDRLEGTAACVAYAISSGARLVRVHDVKPMVRVARMCDALLTAGRPDVPFRKGLR